MIEGWGLGLPGMKVGGIRRVVVPYQLAYGAAGRPPAIPAKSDLIFSVQMLDVVKSAAGGDPRMIEVKPADAKPSDAKPVEAKPAEVKPAAPK